MLIEYITLGDQGVTKVPVTQFPLAKESHGASLYAARINALHGATGEYICFIDGKEDKLLPGFQESMEFMAKTTAAIGWADELVHGKFAEKEFFTLQNFLHDHTIIHHGVVCKRSELLKLKWPIGCFSFEVLAYGALAQIDFARDTVPRYDWKPGPRGARNWLGYSRGIVNSKLFLQGREAVNFSSDLRIYHATN